MNKMKATDISLVSIVVPTFNRGERLRECIESLLRQTYQNYEIIISDDCSTDDTVRIVKEYKDPRIILIENKVNRGSYAARNVAIKKAKGEIIFLTDDDVQVQSDWIEKGLRYFDDPQVVGIEGRIIYVHETYRAGYGDRRVQNATGGQYMTANVAYRKQELLKNGLFDPAFFYYGDLELALRMLKNGKIIYAADTIVVHQLEHYSVKSFMGEPKKIRDWLMLMRKTEMLKNRKIIYAADTIVVHQLEDNSVKSFMDYSVKSFKGEPKKIRDGLMLMRKTDERKYRVHIYEPLKLIALFFPPAILVRLFTKSFRSKRDWLIWFLLYPRLWYERIVVWRYAITNRIFII